MKEALPALSAAILGRLQSWPVSVSMASGWVQPLGFWGVAFFAYQTADVPDAHPAGEGLHRSPDARRSPISQHDVPARVQVRAVHPDHVGGVVDGVDGDARIRGAADVRVGDIRRHAPAAVIGDVEDIVGRDPAVLPAHVALAAGSDGEIRESGLRRDIFDLFEAPGRRPGPGLVRGESECPGRQVFQPDDVGRVVGVHADKRIGRIAGRMGEVDRRRRREIDDGRRRSAGSLQGEYRDGQEGKGENDRQNLDFLAVLAGGHPNHYGGMLESCQLGEKGLPPEGADAYSVLMINSSALERRMERRCWPISC